MARCPQTLLGIRFFAASIIAGCAIIQSSAAQAQSKPMERQIHVDDRDRMVCAELKKQFGEQKCAASCTSDCKAIGDSLFGLQSDCLSSEEKQKISCVSR